VVVGSIFCYRSLSAYLRKKIGEPKEEIEILNGFISMGTALFPSMARLALP
jgi:hypothetical protein